MVSARTSSARAVRMPNRSCSSGETRTLSVRGSGVVALTLYKMSACSRRCPWYPSRVRQTAASRERRERDPLQSPILRGERGRLHAGRPGAGPRLGRRHVHATLSRPAGEIAGRPASAADDVVHPCARDDGAAARHQAGRRSHRALLHLRLHRQCLRPPRRAAGLCRYPPGYAQPRRDPARGADHAPDARDRRGPLRRSRLRDGRHHGDRDAPPDRGGGGQRAWPLRPLPRPMAGHLRQPGHAQLPRDQELQLRRGGRPADQRARDGGTRRDHPREGHQPGPVLSGPGGQVHLAGGRLELPAVRPAGGHAAGPARGARPHPGKAAADLARLRRRSRATGPAPTAYASRSCPATASSRTTCTTCCSRRWRTGRV